MEASEIVVEMINNEMQARNEKQEINEINKQESKEDKMIRKEREKMLIKPSVELQDEWTFGESGKSVMEGWQGPTAYAKFSNNDGMINILENNINIKSGKDYGKFFSKPDSYPSKEKQKELGNTGKILTFFFRNVTNEMFELIAKSTVASIITLNIEREVYNNILAIEIGGGRKRSNFMHHLRFWIKEEKQKRHILERFIIEFPKIFNKFPDTFKNIFDKEETIEDIKHLSHVVNSVQSIIGEDDISKYTDIILRKKWDNLHSELVRVHKDGEEKWNDLAIDVTKMTNMQLQLQVFE